MIGATCRRMQNIFKRRSNVGYNPHRSAFIVLLPEVDPELADKLMSINEDLPEFSKITKEKIGTVIGKQIVDLECVVRNIDRDLEISPTWKPDLFEDILNPLEKSIHSFDTVCGIFNTLYLVDKNIVPRPTFYTVSGRITMARTVLYNTDSIFKKCKKVDRSKLTECKARYVDKILFEGRLNGLDAKPKQRAMSMCQTNSVIEKEIIFKLRTDAARAQFYLTINDPLLISEVPRYLLRKMSHLGGTSIDGPWTVKLHYGIGISFIEFCPDRDMRFMIWHAEDKAASLAENARELVNSVTLEEIRDSRHQKAKALGFKNFFDMTLESKMVDNLDYLLEVLTSYAKIAKVVQYNEVLNLQSFADAHGCSTPIQLWDVSFWGRKHKKFLYNFDNELLRNYLPFDQVLNGLFALCSRLFGIRIEEVEAFDSWHPDVRFFYVFEPDYDKPVAGFYLDPYFRDGKYTATSAMVTFSVIRNASRVPSPALPLIALIGHFEPPDEKHPCLLSFTEARELFGKFGHSLQFLLNKSFYTDVAGINFVEFDAAHLCSNFLSDWIYDEATFKDISVHYETGVPAPNVDLEGVRKYLAGFQLSEKLFKARLDIDMHTKENVFWSDLANELWDDHYIFPMSKYFSGPCRYTDIFSDGWGASYYSVIWSQMLAADIRLAFEEEKDDASVGTRFKDTFLSFGGSCHSRETFRRFRGRDPQPVSLIKYLGLDDSKKTLVENNVPKKEPKCVVTC